MIALDCPCKSKLLHVSVQEWLRGWDAKGWRIDTDTVRANQNKVAYAIPSPQRREAKGWVLDSIPLVDGKKVAAKLKAAS